MLVTLGAFDDVDGKPLGTPFMQASTLMHSSYLFFTDKQLTLASEPFPRASRAAPFESAYPDWRRRLARNLSRRSGGRSTTPPSDRCSRSKASRCNTRPRNIWSRPPTGSK